MKYIKILENFSKLLTIKEFYLNLFKKCIKLGKFKNNNNTSIGNKFDAIPVGLFIVDIFDRYLKGNKFIDVGCGFGNVVKLAKKFNMNSQGIEINKKYKKYHEQDEIKVKYLDARNFNYSNYDVIFLYRPMIKDKDMYNIITQILKTADISTRIIYVNYGLTQPPKWIETDTGSMDNRNYNWVQEYAHIKKNINILKQGPVYWNFSNTDYIDTCIVFDIIKNN